MRRICALILLLIPCCMAVAAPASMDLVDFLVDGRNYVGKEVTITDCHMTMATADHVVCFSLKGHVFIDGTTLEREALRRALRRCSEVDADKQPECAGAVTGVVDAPHGPSDTLTLQNASIRWKQP